MWLLIMVLLAILALSPTPLAADGPGGTAAGGELERDSMLSPGGELALGFDWAFGDGGVGERSGRWFLRPYACLRYMLGVPSGYLSAYLGLAL